MNGLIERGLDPNGAAEAAWLDIKSILMQQNWARVEKNVCADDVLVNENNRGGLGLNPRDFHRNGAQILRTGCNPSKLHDATSIDLAPYGPHRDEQMEFNEKLATNSMNLMKIPTGLERLSSLGCGHFGQLVKATRGGCMTPEQSLQDKHGNLSVEHLGTIDVRYGQLCREGYDHFVLYYDLQIACPRICHLVQLALNASNEVPTKSTEMETCESLKEYMLMRGGTREAAVAAVEATSACKGYVASLAKLVELYIGGENSSTIKRMYDYHSRLGGSGKMGQEFTTAVVDAELKPQSGSIVIPSSRYLREMLMTTAMSSLTLVDGIFTLLNRADVFKVFKHDRAVYVENSLEFADKVLTHLEGRGSISHDVRSKIWGTLLNRMCLVMVNKEFHKSCYDKKVKYETIDHVLGAFTAALQKRVDTVTVLPSDMTSQLLPVWTPEDSDVASAPTKASQPRAEILSSGMQQNPFFIARKRGFETGMYVIEKASKLTFRIVYVHNSIDIVQIKVLERNPLRTSVPMLDFFNQFSPCNSNFEPSRVIDMHVAESAGVNALQSIDLQLLVYESLTALAQKFGNDGPMSDLITYVTPKGLYMNHGKKKGDLILVPLTALNDIKKLKPTEQKESDHFYATITSHDNVVFKLNQPSGKLNSDHYPNDFDANSEMILPLWFLVSKDPKTYNVKELTVTCKEQSCTIEFTCLTNCSTLKAGDRLVKYSPAATAKLNVRQREGLESKPPQPKVPKVCSMMVGLAPPPPKSGAKGKGKKGAKCAKQGPV